MTVPEIVDEVLAGRDLATVPAVEDMRQQVFRMHMSARHGDVRFWTLADHAKDHEMRQVWRDHMHSDPLPSILQDR